MNYQNQFPYTQRITTDATPNTPTVTNLIAASGLIYIVWGWGISLVPPFGTGGAIEYDGGVSGGGEIVHAGLYYDYWYNPGGGSVPPYPQDANMSWLSISRGSPDAKWSYYPQGLVIYDLEFNVDDPMTPMGGLSINQVSDYPSAVFDVTLILSQIQGAVPPP